MERLPGLRTWSEYVLVLNSAQKRMPLDFDPPGLRHFHADSAKNGREFNGGLPLGKTRSGEIKLDLAENGGGFSAAEIVGDEMPKSCENQDERPIFRKKRAKINPSHPVKQEEDAEQYENKTPENSP